MENNLANMMCLDVYLSGLSKEEYEKIKHNIGTRDYSPNPLLSWGVYMEGYHKKIAEVRRKSDLEQVLSLAKRFNWKNDIGSAFSENEYEALILTDKNQRIIWVNDGFTTMTGYSKSFATNKTPRFLQGEKTSVENRERIKTKIALDKPFKDVIINHRKDNSTYKCEVKIIPLFNEKTTHYIAFERQVV